MSQPRNQVKVHRVRPSSTSARVVSGGAREDGEDDDDDTSLVARCVEWAFTIAASAASDTKLVEDCLVECSETRGDGVRSVAYAPSVFRRLRATTWGISEQSIEEHLARGAGLTPLRTNSRSGSKFWVTEDDYLFIKTCSASELDLLRHRFLPAYAAHVQRNPHTLLQKLLGVFEVVRSGGRGATCFLLFQHVLHAAGGRRHLTRTFDLKGSTFLRAGGASAAVWKDVDFFQGSRHEDHTGTVTHHPPTYLEVGTSRDALLLQLHRDVEFLRSLRLMDYSLLVGVETRGSGVLYHLGIIDVLTHYSTTKKFECTIKSVFLDSAEIDCTDPDFYAERFLTRLSKHIL